MWSWLSEITGGDDRFTQTCSNGVQILDFRSSGTHPPSSRLQPRSAKVLPFSRDLTLDLVLESESFVSSTLAVRWTMTAPWIIFRALLPEFLWEDWSKLENALPLEWGPASRTESRLGVTPWLERVLWLFGMCQS